jgi:hypothetical protein
VRLNLFNREQKTMRCHQCERPALWKVSDTGPVLCLDCMHKLQQITNVQFLQNAAMLNLALDEMDAIGASFGAPGSEARIPVDAIARAMKGNAVLNNINISNSSVGVVNTGDLVRIDAAITMTQNTDVEAIGEQLRKLTQAIVDTPDMKQDQKKASLDLVESLADELVRARKPSVMNALAKAIESSVQNAAAVVTIAQGISQLVQGLFGSP